MRPGASKGAIVGCRVPRLLEKRMDKNTENDIERGVYRNIRIRV